MTTDQFFWVLARVAGLSSYAALAIALVTGIALRTAVFDWNLPTTSPVSIRTDVPAVSPVSSCKADKQQSHQRN